MNHWVSIGIAVMWSTGTWKKPWTWPAWRSMVRTRSTPTPSRHLATMRAEIGSRGADFLSWRAYPYQGRTAMIRCAEAPWAASIIVSSSIRASFGVIPSGLVGAGRLDEEDVRAADRLLVAAVDLAVGEGLQRHLAEVEAELAGDLGGQVHRAAAAEDHHLLRVVVVDAGAHLRALLDHAHAVLSSSRISAALRAAYPSMFRCAFSLTARAPSGTSSLITAPAPV